MSSKTILLQDMAIANNRPFVLFAGLNVLESRDLAMQVAEHHASVRKARYSTFLRRRLIRQTDLLCTPRGPGMEEGLKIFTDKHIDVPVITDVHEIYQCQPVAEVCDVSLATRFLGTTNRPGRGHCKNWRSKTSKPQFSAPAKGNIVENSRNAQRKSHAVNAVALVTTIWSSICWVFVR